MIMGLARTVVFAFWAYQQAKFCAFTYGKFGLWAGLMILFYCMLANHLIAAYLKHEG